MRATYNLAMVNDMDNTLLSYDYIYFYCYILGHSQIYGHVASIVSDSLDIIIITFVIEKNGLLRSQHTAKKDEQG